MTPGITSLVTDGRLKATADRKTAFRPGSSNTFGLLPGVDGSCPGATLGPGGCGHVREGRKLPVCYVSHSMSVYKAVGGVLAHNLFLMKSATPAEMTEILVDEFKRFRRRELSYEKPFLNYRLHWSGDVFSSAYRDALHAAMSAYPDIRFWGYTRSFGRSFSWDVLTLTALPNLSLYMSLDPQNIGTGLELYYAHLRARPDARARLAVCYMSPVHDFAARWAAARTTASNPDDWDAAPPFMPPCPADTGKLPLVGACGVCRMCTGMRPRLPAIWFKT